MINELLEQIEQEYNRVVSVNQFLRKQLEIWNKDAEIQKANKLVKYYRNHSLHELSDAEAKQVSRFRQEHYDSCNNSGRFLFELTATGLGETITIKCPICGKAEDITDFSNW